MIPQVTCPRWRSLLCYKTQPFKPKSSSPLDRIPIAKCASCHAQRALHIRTRGNVSPSLLSKSQTLVQVRQSRTRCLTTTPHNPHPPRAQPSSHSSVSPDEVDHFSRLASSWWDPHGPSRLLHLMNPLRFDFIRSLLPPAERTFSNDPKKYTYLDVGCGGGIFASSCARHPLTASVTAIDPTPACIAVAQANQRTDPAIQPPKLTYLNTAIETLPQDSDGNLQKYDIITLFEVLEHISAPSAFLSTAAQHLKPGGWIVGSTIARSATSYLTTKLIAEAPVVGVVPPGTHDWNQYINPGELREWFQGKNEWGTFVTQGVVYIPGLGWKVVNGSEGWGNYFFGVQKSPSPDEF